MTRRPVFLDQVDVLYLGSGSINTRICKNETGCSSISNDNIMCHCTILEEAQERL